MNSLLQLTFVILVLYITWCFWQRRGRPPGPWGWPLIGYLPWLDSTAPYVTLTTLSKKFGPVYGLWLGNVYTVVITDHKIIRKVLAKDVFSGRAPLYLTHGIMNGYGLICAERDLWKDQRKFVTGCLRSFGAVKNSLKKEKNEELITNGVKEFMKLLVAQSASDNILIDPLPILRHSLGNVINSIVFGCTWPMNDPVWDWLQILQEEGTKHIGIAGPLNFLPFLRFLPKYRNTMDFLIGGKLKTHKVYETIIDDHVKTLNVSSIRECENFIDAFLVERSRRKDSDDQSVQFFSDEQFYHLLADMFGAGLDTTLTTLRWFFLFMAAYPEEQRLVQQELDEVMRGKQPGFQDLSALPFTEAAIAETQRIRSVVPIGIPHGTLHDTEVEGFKIPKQTMVVPLQWAIHMNPDNWINPDIYNPARFLNSEHRCVKPDFFMPFQTGKRMCVGDEFARMLLYLFGATVIQNYSVSYPEGEQIDLKGECGITLTPKEHKLVFKKRQITTN